MGKKNRAATAGFLLVETLATFTISAFVLLGLVSAASVLLRSVDRSVAHVESVDDLGRALAMIAHDVAGLKRARWNGMEPQPFVFRGGTNSLLFARISRTTGGSGATQVIALREIVTDAGPRLVRSEARLTARAAAFGELRFGTPREIWTGTARLRFAYVPLRQGSGAPVPQSDWPSGTQLPAAILIEAIDRDTHRVLVSSRVAIEADADIGCVDDSDAGASGDASAQASAAAPGTPPTPTVQGPGGVDFGDLPQPQSLPEPIATPGAAPGTAALTGTDGAFCGRPDTDDDKKAQAGAPPPGTPPPSAPTSAAFGTMPTGTMP